jgi:hypothetical protein
MNLQGWPTGADDRGHAGKVPCISTFSLVPAPAAL